MKKLPPNSKSADSSGSKVCPSCHSHSVSLFYEIQAVPVNSVLLLGSHQEALNFPRGDISLGFCQSCGFIYNLAFDSSLLEYSTRYEATQSYSPSFKSFHRSLAERLIDQYDLRNKDILEIGCGQGEFLELLCEIGGNRGIGFDPVYNNQRSHHPFSGPITFVKDYYSERYAHIQADFVCCKMTLEHIQDTANFVGMIGGMLQDKPDTLVFFQVPDVVRILRETAFWDIYYEHCSYFSLGSLARLFRQAGFGIVDLEKGYDNQYLMITVKPGEKTHTSFDEENDLNSLEHDIASFAAKHNQKIVDWKNKLESIHKRGKRAVIWGASSKGVAFLTTLKIFNEIQYAVDINPNKRNTYMAGTGQKIVSPEFLREYKPDFVIIMNPIYNDEIELLLNDLGVNAKLLNV